MHKPTCPFPKKWDSKLLYVALFKRITKSMVSPEVTHIYHFHIVLSLTTSKIGACSSNSPVGLHKGDEISENIYFLSKLFFSIDIAKC